MVDDLRDRLLGLGRALHRIDNRVHEELARRVQHRDLAARADARVDREDLLLPERRRQQKVAQVLGEDLHGGAVGVGGPAEHRAEGLDHGAVLHLMVAGGEMEILVSTGVDDFFDAVHERGLVDHETYPQDALLLSAADGEEAVARNLGDRLLEIVVLLELRGLGRLRRHNLALDDGLLREGVAHKATNVRDIGDALGDDVARTLEILGGAVVGLVVPDLVRERLEPLLLRDHRTGTAFRLEGLVEVLEGVLLHARLNLRAKVVRELALVLDGLENRRPAILEFGVVAQPLLDLGDLDLVEVAMHLLAVAGDERNRVTFTQKLRDGGDLPAGNPQFGREARQHLLLIHLIRHVVLLLYCSVSNPRSVQSHSSFWSDADILPFLGAA